MTTELDLRDCPEEALRDRLFEALEASDPDDALDVVAERDVDPELVRYQVEHDRGVDWEYADPDAEPRRLRLTVGPSLDDGLASIDVRDLTPQRRHRALLTIFDELNPGEGVVLVNDHDPKPLYHELHSMHGDVFEWEYTDRGAGEWHVEIVKTDDSSATDEDVVTRYDVREIPKQERHPTIHHRYGMIPDGGTMELLAPHEPRPLREEFRRQYGDTFTWTVVDSEPGRCRVRITKAKGVDGADSADSADDTGDGTGSLGIAGNLEVVAELDVRDLPPARRHEQIFERYADLGGGEAFVLVNDHDPKPLYHQFEAEAGEEFRWEYRQREPGEFRVLVGKSDAPTDGPDGTERPDPPF